MTEPSSIRERMPIMLPAVIAPNDGSGNARAVSMLIMVDSVRVSALSPGPLLYKEIGTWVDTYLRGKNLSAVLDFTPTADNIAMYLARVFRGIDPDVQRVSVGFDGESVFMVEFDDEESQA